jgi:hypothetical protein
MTTTTVANPPSIVQDLHHAHYSTIVAQVAATMEKPEYNGRLQKAMDLVLSNSVTLHEDGTASVKSGNGTYHIAPECTCEDAQRRSKFCKHFLSVELLRRTARRLHPTSNGHTPASFSQPESKTSQAAAWAVNEAPISCCLKAWYNATEKAGYAGRVFHSLRRSSARDRIRAGVHERVVMSVNGWKTRAVFDRYNITSTRDAQDALEKIEAYRKSQLQST